MYKQISLRTDLSQSYSRMVISFLAFNYLLFASMQQNTDAELFFKPAMLPIVIFFLFAVLMHFYIRHHPEPLLWRRALTITADTSIACYGMYLIGPFSGVFYPILLWVVIGNGLRFGPQCLYFALGVAVVAFLLTASYTPFFREHLPITVGMFIGLVLLPVFFALLLEELKLSHRQLKKQMHKTHHAATHDMLTGLPNRVSILEKMEDAIIEASQQNKLLAFVFIDLDGFKSINDNYGHLSGDGVLQKVAQRIQTRLRNTDTVARLGGDEFVVLLTDIANKDRAQDSAERLLDVFAEPFHINDQNLYVSGSVGLSLFPEHGSDVDTLIHHADTAMYKVKRRGGNHVETFNLA